MHTKIILLVTFMMLAALTTLAVKVGDRAPELRADQWFNGDPVDPANPDGKSIYVVEFWATWCPPCKVSIPHLNKLHEQYVDKGVTIVGVTTESEKVVKPFVENAKMKYRVALAPREAVEQTWMSNVEGIPHAFVVDTNGIVIWSGHPMDRLDEVLADVVAGTFDPAKYERNSEESDEDLAQFQEYLVEGQFEAALKWVDEKLKHNPDVRLYQMKLGLLVQLEQPDRVKATYREMAEHFWNSADDLNTIAWVAVTAPPSLCDLETAWKAAHRAADLSQRKDAAILDTLARVYYSLGQLPEAIRIQEEAMRVATEESEAKDVRAVLDYYRSAQELLEKIRQEEASP